MHPLEAYLRHVSGIRSTGAATDETAYYPSLLALLDGVGKKLKPTVRCVMGLKNQGAGMPDGGLFTPEQFQRSHRTPIAGIPPARGVIECKKVKDDAWFTADTEQVSIYWKMYRQVLVTNYRDFILIGQDAAGDAVKLETFRLADSTADFWAAAQHPKKRVAELGDRFVDYLQRVMLHAASLAEPKTVAWFLASYARDAKSRMEAVHLPKLDNVRKALEESLGLKIEGDEGDHFFRSTLVQTLFYGVFSAWVFWHRSGPRPRDRFDWEKASKYLRVPILRKLYLELADPSALDDWKLSEVLEWTGNVLNRVDRRAFFSKFKDAEAVQYFYEPFLEAFDPELRKQLGVWYTPPEIVKYMVARVDTVLREDLGRPDGLADKDVYVLDPCCGTGAYLVEVLRTIAATLKERGEDALLGNDLKRAALDRVFGFELLPAPFVVAHLQLGLYLQSEGVPLDDRRSERAAVYLTNALTGWEPPKGPKQGLLFPELEEERDKADTVKQRKPILVVIGNPPYNGFAGVEGSNEELALNDAYRWKAGDPPDLRPQGQGLNDLYIRFFRIAERCITERPPGYGVVCFISNYSWLDQRSHPLMRRRYLEAFDAIWIDSLNGDKYRNGKLTPLGDPDPSVFSTEQNREGIQVGTAITLMVRKPNRAPGPIVRFRDLWGQTKRQDLLKSLPRFSASLYRLLVPTQQLGFPFRPMGTDESYLSWPMLPDLFPTSYPGIFTARDSLVVDIDIDELRSRMANYFAPEVSHEEMRSICQQAMQVANRFEPISTREFLQKRGISSEGLVPYVYRPFDLRWLYWEPQTKLLNEKRTEYFSNVFAKNLWIAAVKQNRKAFNPPMLLRRHATLHIIERGANLFPLLFQASPRGDSLFDDEKKDARRIGEHFANLSEESLQYLANCGGVKAAQDLFCHVAGVLHSAAYAIENADALRQDWPRIPLPESRERLHQSAELGKQVAALLDTEKPVTGVTSGRLRAETKVIAVSARVGGGRLNETAGDLDVTARWGIAGKGGATMPSTGKTTARDYSPEERQAIIDGAAALGLDEATAFACLGETTFDIYLNDVAFWKNVPARVWEYTLGGYQVMKKWLSYREKSLLGRGLETEEVREVTNMARRIAALLLLRPQLDANYQAVKAATYAWPGKGG